MRVDFYQLGDEPAAQMLPQIAGKVLAGGDRLLVVSDDAGQRAALSRALWEGPGFLANGEVGGADDARQPILISGEANPANGAQLLALADGIWRDGLETAAFTRIFLLFGPATIDAARTAWRMLGQQDGIERHFWKRDGRRWVEGP